MKMERSTTEADDAGPRRHGQDRPPGGAAARGARSADVRVGSRSGEPPFDWENEATWAPALRDVESVYVSYYPDLAVPGALDGGALVRRAGRGEWSPAAGAALRPRRGGGPARRARPCRRPALEWTIVRCSWFMQNFSENYLLEPILSGEVVFPAGDVPEPFVDADDIADVAVAALTEDGHAGEIYELTGPRLLTFAEAVGEIARRPGAKIRYVPVSLEEYESMLAEQGVPAEFVSVCSPTCSAKSWTAATPT